MKIIVDGKQKAELPTNNVKHKNFMDVIEMFINNEWETFTLDRREEECLEKPTSVKNADTCTPAKVK